MGEWEWKEGRGKERKIKRERSRVDEKGMKEMDRKNKKNVKVI